MILNLEKKTSNYLDKVYFSDDATSFALRYNMENWNFILITAVYPLMQKYVEEGLIQKYNFYRDWERGQNIKLVLFGDKEKMENEVIPLLREFFNSFFEKEPSPEQEIKLPLSYWFLPYPNNSIIPVNFKFHKLEIAKLAGGTKGAEISFDFFYFSSRSILNLIQENNRTDNGYLTGKALQIMLTFLYGLGISLEEAVQFSESLFENSLPDTDNIFDIYEEEKTKLKEKLVKVRKNLADNFAKQKDQICGFVENYWAVINEYGEVEIEWLDEWIKETKLLNNQLVTLQKEGDFVVFEVAKTKKEYSISAERQQFWFTFQFYIKNFMNQLGVHNLNEINTYYLLKETLRNIKE